jgi:hypothetical protein
MKNLIKIQSELKSPKNQRNNFGNYNYRNCEDILEAVKPLLEKYECTVTISDDIVEVGNRIYVKATATFYDIKLAINSSVSAYAREPEQQKGMSESQITGASSSYARKYALNGLFLIDDTKDADATNIHDAVKMVAEKLDKPTLKVGTELFDKCRAGYLKDNKNLKAIQERYSMDAETLRLLTTNPNEVI